MTPIAIVASGSGDPTARALLNDVEAYLSYLAIVKTPDVDAVRDRIERSLRDAKHELLAALERSRLTSPRRSTATFAEPLVYTRALITARPWLAIGAAAFLGAALGMFVRWSDYKAR